MSLRPLRTTALLLIALLLILAAPAAQRVAAQNPAQTITIESPPPGTQVGSPMVVTGRVARLPASASLNYRFFASDGRVIGAGSFPIPGNPGEPAYFLASLSFEEPLDGDAVNLQLAEADPATGALIGVATLPVTVAPRPQRILIETPPTGTQVGSPVVLTGRTTRLPAAGVLGYAIYDSGGIQVGGGVFPVNGSPQEGGRFNASLLFTFPEFGGPLRIDLYDQDPFTGAFPATASLQVITAALRQQIVIETPPFGTQVGSPVVLTGRAARYPATGALQYRIVDGQGVLLGSGSVPVTAAAGGQARFAASLGFTPPATNGPLRAEIYDIDERGVFTVASLTLRWGP